MTGRSRPFGTALAALLILPALYGFGLPVSVDLSAATPTWATVGSATIHPGVQLVTAGSQCTANFIFTKGEDVLIGMAAHCAGLGGQTDTNGCTTGSRAIGTDVTIEGADHAGKLVYSSWLAMKSGSPSANECALNDFALVKIDSRDHGDVNPTMPAWGGPTGLGGDTALGEHVFSYGRSGLRFGLLSPKAGVSLGMAGGGWSHEVYTVTPGIPGDSGSGLLDGNGRAIGVLSTVAFVPPLMNNYTDLASALTFAAANGMGGVQLAKGTASFSGALTGLLD